jgi:PAS domain S-box-containing protein
MAPNDDSLFLQIKEENETLRQRLEEAESTLEAIRKGEVDALVVDGPEGKQIFSLRSADHTYRVLIEEMNEGALSLSENGTVLYANKKLEGLLRMPLENLIGSSFEPFIDPRDLPSFQALLAQSRKAKIAGELGIKPREGGEFPAYLSINQILLETQASFVLWSPISPGKSAMNACWRKSG